MDVVTENIPADDLRDLIQTAQSNLALAADADVLRRDPYRLILAGLSGILAVFGRSISRWERAVQDVIDARDPLPEADRQALRAELVAAAEDGAYRGMRKEAGRMVRTLDRGLAVRIGLSVSGAFVAGALSVLGGSGRGASGTVQSGGRAQCRLANPDTDESGPAAGAGVSRDPGGPDRKAVLFETFALAGPGAAAARTIKRNIHVHNWHFQPVLSFHSALHGYRRGEWRLPRGHARCGYPAACRGAVELALDTELHR
jgi:hypothetical protein